MPFPVWEDRLPSPSTAVLRERVGGAALVAILVVLACFLGLRFSAAAYDGAAPWRCDGDATGYRAWALRARARCTVWAASISRGARSAGGEFCRGATALEGSPGLRFEDESRWRLVGL